MKKIFGIVLAVCLLSLSAGAAAIQWYSQQPQTTSLAGTDIFSVESPHQVGYKYITFSDLANVIGVWTNTGTLLKPTTVVPVDVSYIAAGAKTHLWYNVEVDSDAVPSAYAKSLLESQYFTGSGAAESKLNLLTVSGSGNSATVVLTSGASSRGLPTLTVSTNGVVLWSVSYDGVVNANGFTDTSLIPGTMVGVDSNNRLVSTNVVISYISVTNLYVLQTNYVNYSFTTNMYATYVYVENLTNNTFWSTNAYIQNITGNKATVINYYGGTYTITNNLFFYTNAWPNGPTGTLALHLKSQRVATASDISITGYTSKSNYVTEEVLFSITNSGASNIKVYLPAGTTTGDGATSYTVTNATTAKIWFYYTPEGETNAIFRWLK